MPGHFSLPASAMGVVPAAFSFLTASRNPLHVVGGWAIPARRKRALLYQKPIMPMSNGMP